MNDLGNSVDESQKLCRVKEIRKKKCPYCMIAFIQNSRKHKLIYSESKQIFLLGHKVGGEGTRSVKREGLLRSIRKLFWMMVF